MNTLIISKKDKASSFSSLKKTFDTRQRKIKELQKQIASLRQECEQTLNLYHQDLKLKEKAAGDIISQFLLQVLDLVKEKKALNKKERITLNYIYKESLELLFSLLSPKEIPEEIRVLQKKMYGNEQEEEFQNVIAEIKHMFKQHTGCNNMDLSDLNPNDTLEELLMKMKDSFENIIDDKDFSPPPKQKTKKDLLKEQKQLDLETAQKQGLANIYKRLVKEFHPDLEQDSKMRVKKEALMKRLTVAYENHDLVTLLSLQSEYMGDVESSQTTENTLRTYNSILQDQIEDLKHELVIIPLDPRYLSIHRFASECRRPLRAIKQAALECDSIIDQYSSRLKDLSGASPLKSLKEALCLTSLIIHPGFR